VRSYRGDPPTHRLHPTSGGPKAPRRLRRSPYESLVEEIMAEEEAWKAEQERERIAAGLPPTPPAPSLISTLPTPQAIEGRGEGAGGDRPIEPKPSSLRFGGP
jgi:hypothetical protein